MRALLKIFFQLFYHNFAWTYDFVAAFVSVGRWAAWRSAALPYIHGPRVLEIGFGTGHLQVELNQHSFLTFGLDESRQMAGIARKNILKHGFQPALSRGYAQNIPYATDCLDSIVATFPSEYITDKHTLAELRRVLRPSGRLVIIPMAWIESQTLIDQAAQGLFQLTGQTVEKTDNLEDRIKSTFNQAGFQVEIIGKQLRDSLVLIIIAEKITDPPEPLNSPDKTN